MAATMMAQLSPSVHVTEAQQQAMSIAESILASPKATDYHMIKATNMLNDLKIQTVPVPSSDGDSSHEVLSPGSESDPEHCGLFIGDLARNATEDQIRDAFNKFGEVVYAEIKRDKVTGNNLGYGFVQFRHRNEALVAKERMDGVAIGSRPIRLGWAQKNTTLFVGDLDGTVTTQMLIEAFSKHGPLIEQETFVKPGCNFGFVRFQHRNDAERAKQEMNRVTIGTCTIRVGWGESNHQRHCVNLQFDPHLVNPNALSEALLRSMFEEFGTVLAVNLPRFHDGRLKGFAFIHFKENSEGEKCATAAINAMTDRCVIENVPMKVGYGKKRVGKHSAGRTGRKFRGSFGGGYMGDSGGGGGFPHSHSHHHIAHRGGGGGGGGLGGHSSYHGPRGGSSSSHPRSQSHNDLHTMSLAGPSMNQLGYLSQQQSHNSPGLVGMSHMTMSSGPHGGGQAMFPNSSWLAAAGPVNPHSYAVPISPINGHSYTPVALSPYGGGPPVFFPQSPQHASSFGAPSPAMQQPPIHGGLRGGGVMSFASMPQTQQPQADLGSPTAVYVPVGYYSQQQVFFPPSPAHSANPQGFGFGAPPAMQQHAPPPPSAMRYQGQQQFGRMGPSVNTRMHSRNGTPSMDHPPQTHPVPPPPLTIAPSSNVPDVTPIPLKPPPLKTE